MLRDTGSLRGSWLCFRGFDYGSYMSVLTPNRKETLELIRSRIVVIFVWPFGPLDGCAWALK